MDVLREKALAERVDILFRARQPVSGLPGVRIPELCVRERGLARLLPPSLLAVVSDAFAEGGGPCFAVPLLTG
jgi:hypothetical protein